MDSQSRKVKVEPLPLEKEFGVLSIRRRLGDLSREELEEFLSESLFLLAKLTHQTQQLKKFISELEG